jgi:multicomponent K+:H+ antiporter subunit A
MAIPAVLARLLLPMAAMVSIYFLLRGHNDPGGGFVGGLVMATAVIVQYMTSGTIWVETRLRVHPLYWIAAGLLSALGAGLVAWVMQEPFLTAQSVHVPLPLSGELHLSTVLLFDLGVYLLVVGATLLILVALAHQSLRTPRKTVTPVDPEAEDGNGTLEAKA